MEAIYALYSDPESARRAINSLRGAGLEATEITVISSEPLEGGEFALNDHRTAMPWLAALGGLAGGISGYFLAALTQTAFPLPTGGMAIVPFWPNSIITYEMTMLGAILVTLLTLLVNVRLPNWKVELYDPEVSDGKILIGVVNPPGTLRVEVERRLREAGASRVKEFAAG